MNDIPQDDVGGAPDQQAPNDAGGNGAPDQQAPNDVGGNGAPDQQSPNDTTDGDTPKPKKGRKKNQAQDDPVEPIEPPNMIVPLFDNISPEIKAKFSKIQRSNFGDQESIKIKAYKIENASETSVLIKPIGKNVPAKTGSDGVLFVDLDEKDYQKVCVFISQRNIAKRGVFLTISEVV